MAAREVTPPRKVVGRYSLYEEIASGGMATVSLGRFVGPEGFTRTVAVKELHEHVAKDPEFVTMLLDEARIAARIRHPNVVPTLDVVQTDKSVLLIMEYVAGETLSHLTRHVRSRGEAIPQRIVAAIVSGMLHGLHAAHETRGDEGELLELVHRDVSPQNVIVGADGVARVLDFGVAKALGRVTTTMRGQIKGKFAYMSPEHLSGKSVDRRTDIYASAVVLWETLTMRRLVQGEKDPDIVVKILRGWTTAPSEVAPTIDKSFDAVTMRGLSTDPAKRFATAREMAREVERCVGIATPSEVSDWLEEHASDLMRDRTQRVALLESSSGSGTPGPAPAPAREEDLSTAVSESSEVRPRTAAPPEEAEAIDVEVTFPHLEAVAPVDEDPATTRYAASVDPLAATAPALSPPEPFVGTSRPARGFVVMTVVGLGLVVVGVAAIALRAGTRRGAAPAPSPSAAESAPAVGVPRVEPPAEPVAVVVPAPPEPVPPPRASASAPSPSPPVGRRPAGGDCNPPYYFDADGKKHYKRNCD